MTTSRASQVDLDTTPYYHCIGRCVRRALLCGYDPYSNKDYAHRKAWLLERLRLLARVFAIDLCAYAVMSNHYHVVLRVDRERALSWDEDEVLERYSALFKNVRLQLEVLPDEMRAERVALYRSRLCDLSWFMRSLNEHIARRANREDECTGRFWEGRFKSQPLLDEAGLLTCMGYVDLNRVRAGACQGLEDSDFTSIQERLVAASARLDDAASVPPEDKTHELVPFADEPGAGARGGALPMTLTDYAELLDWTGRFARPDKGRVTGAAPSLLQRRGIDPEAWLQTMSRSGLRYLGTLGACEHLAQHAERSGKRWLRGVGWARRMFRADVERPAFRRAA